jgi:hypothetical protein
MLAELSDGYLVPQLRCQDYGAAALYGPLELRSLAQGLFSICRYYGLLLDYVDVCVRGNPANRRSLQDGITCIGDCTVSTASTQGEIEGAITVLDSTVTTLEEELANSGSDPVCTSYPNYCSNGKLYSECDVGPTNYYCPLLLDPGQALKSTNKGLSLASKAYSFINIQGTVNTLWKKLPGLAPQVASLGKSMWKLSKAIPVISTVTTAVDLAYTGAVSFCEECKLQVLLCSNCNDPSKVQECEWNTLSPTARPSNNPSSPPSKQPSAGLPSAPTDTPAISRAPQGPPIAPTSRYTCFESEVVCDRQNCVRCGDLNSDCYTCDGFPPCSQTGCAGPCRRIVGGTCGLSSCTCDQSTETDDRFNCRECDGPGDLWSCDGYPDCSQTGCSPFRLVPRPGACGSG